MLFTGRLKMSSRDGRFSLKEEDGTLVLAEARPEDAGSYVCRIMAETEISVAHTLHVRQNSEEDEEQKGGFSVKSVRVKVRYNRRIGVISCDPNRLVEIYSN
jgi:hypothetical protein